MSFNIENLNFRYRQLTREDRLMKKTLLEHHYELRIASLRDDSIADCAKRIAVVEHLATEHGWKHLCEGKCIDINLLNNTNCQCGSQHR